MLKKITSPNEMITLWGGLSKYYKKILLYWNLWAWKTQFVKWFAKWLEINPELVKSPTYTYVNIYNDKLLHIDMYKIDNFKILLDKGILDLIDEFDYICIERPKREEQYIDNEWTKVDIKKISENERIVKITRLTNFQVGK